MNDMYILDLTTMKWRQLTIYGDVPNPTSNLSVVAANPTFPGQPILLYLVWNYACLRLRIIVWWIQW